MARKTIPQLNPLVGNINENTLVPIDTGTQTFKSTAAQLKEYIVAQAEADIDGLQGTSNSLAHAIGVNALSSFKEVTIKPVGAKKANHTFFVDAWASFITCHNATASGDELFSMSSTGSRFYPLGLTGRTSGFKRMAYNPTTNKVLAISDVASGTNLAILTNSSSDITDTTVVYQTATFDSGTITDGIYDFKYLPINGAFFLVGAGGKVFKSLDGVSWQLKKNPVLPILLGGYIVEGKDGRILCCSLNKIFYSDDGGDTWTESISAVANFNITGLAYSEKQGTYIVTGTYFSQPASCLYSPEESNGEVFLTCRIGQKFMPGQDKLFNIEPVYIKSLDLFVSFGGMYITYSPNARDWFYIDGEGTGFIDSNTLITYGAGRLVINGTVGISPAVEKIFYSEAFEARKVFVP